jgi:hypothetical protein
MVFGQEAYVGTLNLHWSVPRPESLMLSSPSDMVQVEVLRVAYEEGSAPGAPAQEKTAEAPRPVGAARANATPHNDSGHAKEAGPWPEMRLARWP